jgi:signal transduction histidine kinase
LQLDAVIGRAITFVILVLAIILIYATGSYFLDIVFDVEFDIIQRNGVFIALLGVALIGQRQIQTFVDLLIYGREQLDSVSILKVTAMLSADPAPSTMADVVSQIADVMNSQQVAVMIKDKHTYKLLAGIATITPFELADTKELQQTFLRARDLRKPFDLPGWVELSIPIDIQGEIHGLFLLSRPLNGLFNSRQIKRLHDVADVLAFGLQVIRLLNIVHKVPTRIEYEKMLQFQKIATDIHNRPLHTLAMIRPHLKGEQIEVQSAIQQATKDLRRIMAGLHPPELEKSIEWMTREVVREFEENHDHEVHIAIDIQNEKRVPKHIKYVVHAVLTEALNNVVKHAQATTIHVSLCYSSDLRLTVSDDGLGMEIATMSLNGALQDNHFGLAHMQRWAMMGGGRLFIRGNEPTGLVVE